MLCTCIKVHESNALDGWTGRTPVETCKAVDPFLWKKEKKGARKIFARSIQGGPTPDRIHQLQLHRIPVAQVFISSYDPVLAGTLACTSSFVQQ